MSAVKSFDNTLGNGEIARKELFLLFQVFSTLLENFLPFSTNLKIVVCLEESKICRLGRGLSPKYAFINP